MRWRSKRSKRSKTIKVYCRIAHKYSIFATAQCHIHVNCQKYKLTHGAKHQVAPYARLTHLQRHCLRNISNLCAILCCTANEQSLFQTLPTAFTLYAKARSKQNLRMARYMCNQSGGCGGSTCHQPCNQWCTESKAPTYHMRLLHIFVLRHLSSASTLLLGRLGQREYKAF